MGYEAEASEQGQRLIRLKDATADLVFLHPATVLCSASLQSCPNAGRPGHRHRRDVRRLWLFRPNAAVHGDRDFDFSTSKSEALDLNLLSDNFSGIGFDSLELKVIVDGTAHVYKRSRLAGAESFFAADALDLGTLAAGSQTIKLEYFLDYNAGTSAGAGFGFTYDFATTPVAPAYALTTAAPLTKSIPEASTWAMMALGFAGLGFAGYRRSRKRAAFAT